GGARPELVRRHAEERLVSSHLLVERNEGGAQVPVPHLLLGELRLQVLDQLVLVVLLLAGAGPEIAEEAGHPPPYLPGRALLDEGRRLLVLHPARGAERGADLLRQLGAELFQRDRLEAQGHLPEEPRVDDVRLLLVSLDRLAQRWALRIRRRQERERDVNEV